MTNDPMMERMRELSWRRKLTPSEAVELRAWLAANPGRCGEWELEANLNELLERLPEPPVSSNFTQRVLQAVQLESAAEQRRRRRTASGWQHWWRWLPRAAFAAVVMSVGLVSYHQIHLRNEQAQLAEGLVTISEVNPEFLKDFDAIHAMSRAPQPQADEDLLRLLQ